MRMSFLALTAIAMMAGSGAVAEDPRLQKEPPRPPPQPPQPPRSLHTEEAAADEGERKPSTSTKFTPAEHAALRAALQAHLQAADNERATMQAAADKRARKAAKRAASWTGRRSA